MRILKLAIIGNGGGGKSTAARRLSSAWDVPFYSVDHVQWLPGWERADAAAVAEWHATILSRDAWIIDGWGAWELIEARFDEADQIVLVDFPLATHLEWAARREVRSAEGDCEEEPEGCRYADIPDLMRETLERVDRDLVPRLRELVALHEGISLRSPAELDAWLEASLRRVE